SSILIVLGLHIGNYIDQNLLNQMVNWIWTTIIMLGYIIVSILIVSKYLQKFSGYKQKTSIFSAAPGALGPLLILAEYEKSDLSQVATAHLIRLIIIITLFPFIIVSLSDSDILEIQKFDYMAQNHWDLVILIIASIIFIFFFDKAKVPAALLSGTLVASGIFQIFDIASYKLPDASINFCLLILGASVGCRFANKTVKEVANNSFHGLVATILLVLLGLVAAFIATFFVDNNFLTLVLSFCPGGIYEVAVIAIAFDLEPDFVAFHHIIRLLFILFIVPVAIRLIEKTRLKN
ncbi:AbrB family transcriptional regulator, partial [Pelagibacterales bacterium SAG-MED37]|nr:AbrB family transcriptional regulator [Pelagibacterales bacterium SAG-MED37]